MANSEIDSDLGCNRPQHVLTFDVEDWHRGLAPGQGNGDAHLELAMDALLDSLSTQGLTATFFVLGDDAPRITSQLLRCVRDGHEVASHGMRHERVDTMSRTAFREDVLRSFSQLEDITQKPCSGYRAPWFSLSADSAWAFDILAEAGATYDASLRQPLGAGAPPACRDAGLREVSVPLLQYPWGPFGILSGLLFRVLPRPAILAMLAQCTRMGIPGCLYLHPYEWMRSPSPIARPLMQSARRRVLVSQTLPKLRWLATQTRFASISDWLAGQDSGSGCPTIVEAT